LFWEKTAASVLVIFGWKLVSEEYIVFIVIILCRASEEALPESKN
jgi:hypothetical protein